MHRRTLLATVGVGSVVGLAGCSTPDNGEPGTDDPNNGEPPAETWLSDGLEFEVDHSQPSTDTGPATVDLSVTNTLETECTATATHSPVVPFAGRFGYRSSQDGQLLVTPVGGSDQWFQADANELVDVSAVLPDEPVDGCWRIPSQYDGIADPPGQISREIQPDETLDQQYELYHMHDCGFGQYTAHQSVMLAAEEFETEPHVPLVLRLTMGDDGGVEVDSFGVSESYTPVVD